MLRHESAACYAGTTSVLFPLRAWKLGCTAAGILGFVLIIWAGVYAQPSPSPQPDAGAFFRSITGEWVGICEQSTDGEQADNKYFYAAIEQVGPNSFAGQFSYYRYDESTGIPLHVGDANVLTTIEPDGSVTNRISGRGTMLVDNKPKQQQHELLESLTGTDSGGLTGRIRGKISVGGMPFGLGKNGSVYDGTSTWSLNGDVLTIRQSLKAGFRILFFTKSYTVEARSTASRGSDVVSLMKTSRVATKPENPASGGS